MKRRREEPSGTVGGRIPWAKTPRCEGALAELHRRLGVADLDRDDLGLRVARREALGGERRAQDGGVGAQPLDPARVGFEQLQGRVGGGDRRAAAARSRR